MNIQTLPYVLPLVVSIGSSLLVVYYAYRRHTTPGSRSLIAMSCAIALWSFCTIVSMYQTDLATLITWANIQSISLAVIPTGWLVFAVQYTGRERWLTSGVWRWLALEPVVFEVMIWTDRYHSLIRNANWLDTGGPFPIHLSTFAAGYWGHVGYSYILIAIGTVLLIKELVHSYHLLYRGQAIALICAVAAPWVANVVQLAKLSPIPNMAHDASGLYNHEHRPGLGCPAVPVARCRAHRV